jgi:hypothetical protein
MRRRERRAAGRESTTDADAKEGGGRRRGWKGLDGVDDVGGRAQAVAAGERRLKNLKKILARTTSAFG